MKRKLSAALNAMLLIAGLIAAAAAPASADQPASFEVDIAYEDVNPCTGELVFYEETITVTEHPDHPNNFVGSTSGSGFSSDGYVLQSRVEHFQANNNVVTFNLMEIWRHPDGAALRVTINAKGNPPPGEPPWFEQFRLECLGA